MINLTEQEFIEKVRHEKEHFKYVEIPKTAHLYKELRIVEDLDNQFYGEPASNTVIGAYIDKINPGAHLGKVVSKFSNMEPIIVPATSQEIDPKELMDALITYCEQRRERPIIAVQDETNGLIMGVVSPDYVPIQNCDVYTLTKEILRAADIPHEATYEHDSFQMRINYRFPEMAIDLPDVQGEHNEMQLSVSVFNGMTGGRSLGSTLRNWEQWCSNGAMGWRTVYEWRRPHIGRNIDFFHEFTNNFTKQLKNGEQYLGLLEVANEIADPIIKENEDIIKVLSSDKFKLQVGEAEEVYRRMRHHRSQYPRRNGFDIGRAVAEVARDNHNLNRRIELEVIAGEMMLMQVPQ